MARDPARLFPAAAPRPRGVETRRFELSWGQGVTIVAVGILLGLGGVQLVTTLGRPILLLTLAVTLASTLSPAVQRLERSLPRGLAVAGLYLALLVTLVLVGWAMGPTVSEQAQQLMQSLPGFGSQLQQRFSDVLPKGIQLEQAVARLTETIGFASVGAVRAGVSGIFEILVIAFLSGYFLMVGPRFHAFAVSLAPRHHRRRTARVLTRMSKNMGGYFRGAVIDGVIIGLLTWFVLWILGRPFAAPLGLISAFGELVPYIGPIVAALPAVALALIESPGEALVVALAYVAIQQIEGNVVTPLVMHSQTDITPATVLFAVVSGFAVAGILGAVAAVPLFAAVRVLVLRVLLPWRRCAALRDIRHQP